MSPMTLTMSLSEGKTIFALCASAFLSSRSCAKAGHCLRNISTCAVVDQAYRLGLALCLKYARLFDALCLLYIRAFLAVGRRLCGGRKSTAAIFSFSALTTLFIVSCTSLGGSISLMLCPDNLNAPVGCLFHEGFVQFLINLAPL